MEFTSWGIQTADHLERNITFTLTSMEKHRVDLLSCSLHHPSRSIIHLLASLVFFLSLCVLSEQASFRSTSIKVETRERERIQLLLLIGSLMVGGKNKSSRDTWASHRSLTLLFNVDVLPFIWQDVHRISDSTLIPRSSCPRRANRRIHRKRCCN